MLGSDLEKKISVILSPYEAEMLYIVIRNHEREIPASLRTYFKKKKILRKNIGDVNPSKTRLEKSQKYKPGRGNKLKDHQENIQVKFYGVVEYKDLRDLYYAMCNLQKRFLEDEDKLLIGWNRDIFFASLSRIKKTLIKALKVISIEIRDKIKAIHKDDLVNVKAEAIKVLETFKDKDLTIDQKHYIIAFINGYPGTLHNNDGVGVELELFFSYLVGDDDYHNVIKPLSQRYVDMCNIKIEYINFGIVEKFSESTLRSIALNTPAKKKGSV